MTKQLNIDGDSYEPRTPLVRLGQGDYTRDYHEVDLAKEPTGATAAYCLIAFVFAVGFIVGCSLGMWINGGGA